MSKRPLRLVRALMNESAKRIPYILLIMGLILLYQGYTNSKLAAQNSADAKILIKKVDTLSQDNKRLSQDNKRLSQENQSLSQQNIRLSQENASHIDCVKQLFVDFINTRQNITEANSNACTVQVKEYTTPKVTNQSVVTPKKTTSTKKPITKPITEPIQRCRINILGMHLFCA